MRWKISVFITLLCAAVHAAPARGPLRVCPQNPRYFADADGNPVYLTGSHVWNNLTDMGPGDPPPRFDFDAYLTWMQKRNHNFMRLWTWELVLWNTVGNSPKHRNKPKVHTVAPLPWARTGPGNALDGKPKFDLTRYDEEYFRRMRARVTAAGARGIYTAIMCFEGWGLQRVPDAWRSHPMNPANNINGVDGDANGDGMGLEVHTLTTKRMTELQEAYVRKVIDTVNDLDNVLYEISNENHPASTKWQYHMINFIHAYERTKPKRHPVGMTFQFRGGTNADLFKSPADWISPNAQGGYRDSPPPADGKKVVLNDTDHLWGIGGNSAWVWKSFCRGHNPIFMDPYDGVVLGNRFDKRWDPIRRSCGDTRRFAQRMRLADAKPHGALSSTKYCLAAPGSEYLVYNPDAASRTFQVHMKKGVYTVEWFDPSAGKTAARGRITLALTGDVEFKSPFEGPSVVYLTEASEN